MLSVDLGTLGTSFFLRGRAKREIDTSSVTKAMRSPQVFDNRNYASLLSTVEKRKDKGSSLVLPMIQTLAYCSVCLPFCGEVLRGRVLSTAFSYEVHASASRTTKRSTTRASALKRNTGHQSSTGKRSQLYGSFARFALLGSQ